MVRKQIFRLQAPLSKADQIGKLWPRYPMSQTVEAKKILPWIIVLIFFAVLNETVFSVATPAIQATFHRSEASVSWISSIFLLTFGIGAVVFGKLADVINLRTLIAVGVWLYSAASVLGFLVQGDFYLILGARALQGFGCASLPSLVFAVAGRYVAANERGQVFGYITSFVAISIGIGPVLGGLISDALGWTWLFLIPLPVLIALVPLRKLLLASENQKASLDLVGTGLVALTVGFLILTVNKPNWWYAAAFGLSFLLLIPASRLIKNPFIPLDLFKNGPFSWSVLAGFLLFSVVMSLFFLMPQVLTRIHGLVPTQVGLFLFPGAIFPFFIGPFVGKVADKKGNYFVVMTGLTLLVSGLVLLGFLAGLSPWAILVLMVLVNAGFAFFQTGIMNSVSQHLPGHEIGIGMGLFNLLSVIAGAVGVAVVGSLLTGKALPLPLWDFMSSSALYNNTLFLEAGLTLAALVIYGLRFWKLRGPAPAPSGEHHGH